MPDITHVRGGEEKAVRSPPSISSISIAHDQEPTTRDSIPLLCRHLADPAYFRYEEKVLSRWPEIFVGCLLFVLIVAGIIVWRCCVRRKRRNAKKAAAMGLAPGAVTGAKPDETRYTVLSGASGSAVNLQEMRSKSVYGEEDPYAFRGKPGSVV